MLREVLSAGGTVLVVAHNLKAVETADQIIFIENGEVTEEGTHPKLMAKRGRYHQYYQNCNVLQSRTAIWCWMSTSKWIWWSTMDESLTQYYPASHYEIVGFFHQKFQLQNCVESLCSTQKERKPGGMYLYLLLQSLWSFLCLWADSLGSWWQHKKGKPKKKVSFFFSNVHVRSFLNLLYVCSVFEHEVHFPECQNNKQYHKFWKIKCEIEVKVIEPNEIQIRPMTDWSLWVMNSAILEHVGWFVGWLVCASAFSAGVS